MSCISVRYHSGIVLSISNKITNNLKRKVWQIAHTTAQILYLIK